jgi:hypothetical protein
MRRKLSFLVTLWWIILCGALGACMLLFANRSSVVSEQENRTLSGMPSFSMESMKNGQISEQFESFLTDQFFLRSDVVDGMNALKHLFSALTVDELLNEDGEEVFVPEAVNPVQETTAGQDQVIGEEQPLVDGSSDSSPESTVVAGETTHVWLNHKNGTKDALFTFDQTNLQKAADVINAYAALLPVGGTVHVMLAPRAQTANKLALHLDTESGWTSEMEAALQALVSRNVTIHNPYEILQNAILNGEYIFFRTDHHWTARGAYLAVSYTHLTLPTN